MNKSEITNIKPFGLVVFYNKIIRYYGVGRYLHLSALIGLYFSFLGASKIFYLLNISDKIITIIPWFLLLVTSISLSIIAELDVRGRYQNYKQVKEKLYKFGYDERIVRLYMHSNCQRDAVRVAGYDLGYHKVINKYFYDKGYRWYHILPDAFINNPMILFSKEFWIKILFTDYYQLKYFYW